jgi:hypothetical protein
MHYRNNTNIIYHYKSDQSTIEILKMYAKKSGIFSKVLSNKINKTFYVH